MALETIKFVGRALFLRSGYVFHRIGRTMAVARTAKYAAATALFEPFGVQPPLDPLEADGFFAFVVHEENFAQEKV